MRVCNAHRECAGFTHYPSYTIGSRVHPIKGFDEVLDHNVLVYKKRDICVLRTLIKPVEDFKPTTSFVYNHEKADCYKKSKGTDYLYCSTHCSRQGVIIIA